jgi:hypothetical protein
MLMDYTQVVAFLQATVIAIWSMWEVKIIMIHTLVNFVVAIAVALSAGQFAAGKLVEFFTRKLLPLVLVYSVFKFAGSALAGAPPSAGFGPIIQFLGNIGPYAVLAAIELLLMTDLVDNLAKVPGLEGLIGMIPTSLLGAFIKEDTKVERALTNNRQMPLKFN